VVGGRRIRLGSLEFVEQDSSTEHRRFRRRLVRDGGSAVFLAVDGVLRAAFVLDDAVRPESARVIRAVRRLGIGESVMLTGDHPAIGEAVGAAIGIDTVRAGLSPEDKVAAVRESQRERVTLMAGDGINDAPALAAADIGIAMGARGATSASEAAAVVLLVDRLDRVLEAITIAQRSRRIAIQSIVVGMGLSLVAMALAAAGFIAPVAGALLQEGIDIVAIGVALRALRGGRAERAHRAIPSALAAELVHEHPVLLPRVERLRAFADSLDEVDASGLAGGLETTTELLAEIQAHERADESSLYPRLAEVLPGSDPLAAMSMTHREIFHLLGSYFRLASDIDPANPPAEDIADLRRLLYSLHAVLRLNMAQEEELVTTFGAEPPRLPDADVPALS
jgi:hypothetical protein